MKNNCLHVCAFLAMFPASVASVFAAEVTLTTPGTLGETLTEGGLLAETDLKINGTVNASDFFFIRDNMPSVASVDMTDAVIAACTVDGVAYDADAVPAEAFSDPLMSEGMNRLNTFCFPATTQAVGNNAFYKCNVLRATNLDALTSLRYIGNGAFSRCNRLRELVLPASVVELGDAAFAYNTALASFTLSDGSSLSVIGGDAFRGNIRLSSLDFSVAAQLHTVGDYAFAGCSALSALVLPASVDYVGEGACMYTALGVADWSHLASLDVLEGSLFYGVTSLTQVKLPAAVREVRSGAFSGCTALKEVSLSQSLALVGDWAFSSCTALDSVYCPASSVPVMGYRAFDGLDASRVTVAVSEALLPQYEVDPDWGAFRLVGVSMAGVQAAHAQVAVVVRSGGRLTVKAAKAIDSLSVYDMGGSLLLQHRVGDTVADVAVPALGKRLLVSLVYEDGTTEVVKK